MKVINKVTGQEYDCIILINEKDGKDNFKECEEFCGDVKTLINLGHFKIRSNTTAESWKEAKPGDYIVKITNKNIMPLHPDVFEKNYELKETL